MAVRPFVNLPERFKDMSRTRKKASNYPIALGFSPRQRRNCLVEICGYGFYLMECIPVKFIEISQSF